MKIAILFNGISFCLDKMDFRNNIDNIVKNLIEPLKNTGNIIDIYYTTYTHDFIHLLEHTLEPISKCILPFNRMHNTNNSRVLELYLSTLNLIHNDYDYIIMTKFDINLNKSILEIDFNKEKINFLCKDNSFNKNEKNIIYNDDTFITVPRRYIQLFINVVKNLIQSNKLSCQNLLYDSLFKLGIKNEINFIYNETHNTTEYRPWILFNREINYNPSSFIINEIPKCPFVKYKNNKCILKYVDNEIIFFKFPDSKTELLFHFRPSSTKVEIVFDIAFQARIPDNDELIFQYDNKVKIIDWNRICVCDNYTNIREQFDILRNNDKNIILSMNRIGTPLQFKIRNLKINMVEPSPRIHFVSFYTEGHPYDLCINMTQSRNIFENSITPYVDSVNFYTPRRLMENSESAIYVQPFNTTPNPYNPGVHNIGFLKWKPYIILKELEGLRNGDIVYYRDGNLIKYPAIVHGICQTRELISRVLIDDIFVPIENHPTLKMKKNVKREIFEELGEYNDTYLEAYGYNSSIVICRKSPLSMRIMQEWLDGCMKDHLIIYDSTPNQHPEYGWNVQEQSILNVILQKYKCLGLLPIKFPYFSLNDRTFLIDALTRIPKIAILIVGEMRNFDNKKMLESNELHLFKKYNCDIFVSTWSQRGFSFNHGYYSEKGYASDRVNEDDIKRAYNNVKGLNIERYEEWFASLDSETQRLCIKGFYNVGTSNLLPASAFPQLYKLWDANRMKCNYERENGFTYDLVIKFRADMCLVEEIPKEYLKPFLSLNEDPNKNSLFHLNPPRIFDADRIYDIFFYGNTDVMNKIADSWTRIKELIDHPFDNQMANVNACRLLFVQALINNIKVIDIPRCIGDIYRDENFDDYVRKILYVFNDTNDGNNNNPNVPMINDKYFRGRAGKFLRRR